MRNKINKYFFQQFSYYFAIVLFALVLIVWIVQAVNYLDLVIDDGHAFTTYFSYSLLNIPKIITRLLPFCFLTTLIFTISKLEKDNELIVFWTSGLNKIKIVNLIFILSIVIMFVQFVMATTISPYTLNLSRSILKNSSLDFFPTLIKAKRFNDTVEGLTIFVEKKSPEGLMENVFIRDENKILQDQYQKSSTIVAKKGYLKQDKNSKYFILYNGVIQKEDSDGKINFIKFEKINLNLGDLTTKSILQPKVQETSTIKLFFCTDYLNLTSYEFLKNLKPIIKDKHNCSNSKHTVIELNRRFGMPFYIPILSLLGSFLLATRQNKGSSYFKFIYFLFGFFVLVFAEIFTRYSGETFYSTLYYLIPFIIVPIVYIILIKKFKYENLRL